MTGPVAASKDHVGDLAELARFAEGTDLEETDPLTKLFLGAATEAVRNYCEWHIFPVRRDVLVLDGSGGTLLELPTGRLVSIESLTENGVTLTPDVDFEWSQTGRLRKRRCWTDRYRSIVATIEHGHASAQDLLTTIYAVASRAASAPQGAVVDNAGPFTFSAAQLSSGSGGGLGLFAHEKEILDRYALARP